VEAQKDFSPCLTNALANIFSPSLEQATHDQVVIGALVCLHVRPESLDTKTGPGPRSTSMSETAAATSFAPSAEEAIETQFVLGALVLIQPCA
jgi:hypothetical protein